MGVRLFEAGHCAFCREHTPTFCDECNVWCCKVHRLQVRINVESELDFCEHCKSKAIPGAIVGGVAMTKQMLS